MNQHNPLVNINYSPITKIKTREQLLDRAREIGELAWSRREETERARRLPDDVMDALRASDLMKLCRHSKWGGGDADPMTFLDVGRELGRGSGSLGWLYSVLGFHDWYMAFASEQLQQDVWGKDREAIVCDSYAPIGQITQVEGGYLVSGRWRFASGIEWSSWIAVGGIVPPPDGDKPEFQFFFVPKSDLIVEDDWYTLGLRGTASRAVNIERTFVPSHRTLPIFRLALEGSRGDVVKDGPLWRMPLFTMQALAAYPPVIGLAQRMLDEFRGWTKQRIRPYQQGAQARDAPAPQLAWARAATQWDGAWALAQKYAEFGWKRGVEGSTYELNDEERAQLFSWRSFIARTCLDLTDDLYKGAGAMALFDSHPLQQIFRDAHSAGVHVSLDLGDAYTSRGRVAMGLEGDRVM